LVLQPRDSAAFDPASILSALRLLPLLRLLALLGLLPLLKLPIKIPPVV